MGYIVAETTDRNGYIRYLEIPEAENATVDDQGVLKVWDAVGGLLAIFRSGEWVTVFRDKKVWWARGEKTGGPFAMKAAPVAE